MITYKSHNRINYFTNDNKMKSVKGKVKEPTPWTNTGSFIKKPSSGWLHSDRDLMNGSSITYSVRVCLERGVYRITFQHVWPYIVSGQLCRVTVDEDATVRGPYSSHEVYLVPIWPMLPLIRVIKFPKGSHSKVRRSLWQNSPFQEAKGT